MTKHFLRLFAVFFCSTVLAQTALVRNPSLSPTGSELAFSYQGDIWVYNLNTKASKRITIHEAYERNPIWSPDGKYIAFASNRKGSDNVFVVSKDGGTPKQMTYYPAGETPYDWTKDNNILFSTSRVMKGPPRDTQTYHVNLKGGTPQRTFTALGSMATMSPDGKFIAYVKGYCRLSREDYSGAAQRDIWLYNTQTKAYTQITDTPKNEHSPLWDADGNLYFIGAQSGRYNIYKQPINSANGYVNGRAQKLTNQTKNGVVSYSVSDNGTIVYSTLFDLYHWRDAKLKKLVLELASDYRFETEKTTTTRAGISNFDISPSGKLAALEIRGEIFVKLNNKEKTSTNNVSDHPFRDRNPQFISDKELLFISDRDGHNEIYMARSKDTLVGLERSLKLEVKKLTSSKEDVYNLLVSPDHKKVAYQIGRGILMVADYKDGKITNGKVFSDTWGAPEGVSWSPDSKYLAYAQEDLNFDSEIFIQSVANPSMKINVSMHPRSDVNPVWSPNGKMISFTSNRSGNRGGIDFDVWMVYLQKEDWERSRPDRKDGDYYQKTPKKSKKGKKVAVKIDADRIYDRLVRLTYLADDEYGGVFSSDSKSIYYSATNPATNRRSFYKVKIEGGRPKEIKGTSNVGGLIEAKGKFYFTSRGRLNELNTKSDRVTALPHSAKYTQDFMALNEQVFNEGTRVLTMGFYDPNFHGYDWKALIKRYKPLAMKATTSQDYQFVFNQMLGQLNASHMGYRSGTPERRNSDNIGMLGLEVKNTNKGAEILYVLPNSVADKSKVDLNVGDVITHVNGEKISKNTNFYSLLKNTRGDEVLLTLSNGDEVVARTASSLRTLQYEAFVASRKALVDKFSNGKLGYIHIQGMNAPSFERFERELKASGYGKEGIVIDVRYNGGGWTTDRLMAVLNVYQHAYTIPRGAAKNLEKENKKFTKNYPFNERAILSVNTKPTVALCNEYSYSNAEIFSHAYKNLGLGKLVGQPTFGAVISTGGYSLSQGYVRMPFRAWYVAKSGKSMENEAPAVPDYFVKNAPGWYDRGEDDQLKKAVDVLLEQLK